MACFLLNVNIKQNSIVTESPRDSLATFHLFGIDVLRRFFHQEASVACFQVCKVEAIIPPSQGCCKG